MLYTLIIVIFLSQVCLWRKQILGRWWNCRASFCLMRPALFLWRNWQVLVSVFSRVLIRQDYSTTCHGAPLILFAAVVREAMPFVLKQIIWFALLVHHAIKHNDIIFTVVMCNLVMCVVPGDITWYKRFNLFPVRSISLIVLFWSRRIPDYLSLWLSNGNYYYRIMLVIVNAGN